jgi:hypothetical protein
MFMSADTLNADGDRILYEKITNDRNLAGVRGLESRAHKTAQPDRVYIEQGLIHAATAEEFSPKDLYYTAGYGTPLRSDAQSIIVKGVERILGKFWRLREYICARLLQDAAGVTISPTAAAWPSGASTVTNTVTIHGALQTYAIGNPWNLEATKMFSDTGANQLPGLKDAMENDGFRVGNIIFNRTVAAAVEGNLEAQAFLINQSQTRGVLQEALKAQAIAQGQDPELAGSNFNGLGDIEKWHNFNHVYTNGAGAATRYVDSDKAIALAADLRGVLAFAEGRTVVPALRNVIGDARQAQELWQTGFGMMLFARRLDDDVGTIRIVGRDTFCPLVKNELGVRSLTGVTA